jgi:hypothetical protein
MSATTITVNKPTGTVVIQGSGPTQTVNLTTGETQVVQLGSLSAAVNQQITQAVTSATASAATATQEAGVATSAASTATVEAGVATTEAQAAATSAAASANAYSAIANGTATPAGTLTGTEISPLSRGAGLLQATLSAIADFVLGQLTLTSYTALRSYSGIRTYAVITGAGIAGQFSRLGSASGLSDNGGTIIFDANGNAWQRLGIGPVICAEWFGWVGGEAGAVLNAAQAAAVYHQCTDVTYSSPSYLQTTPINAVNGIVIRGPGMGPEGVIRVVAGTAIDAQYQTPNFETQYATQPTTVAQGVIRDFGLQNVCLDGNCGSNKNTPVTTNGLKGMGFRVYGARPKFRNVWVMRQPGVGAYSFFTATPTELDFGNNIGVESRDGSFFDNICCEDTQYEGLVFQGPSDISVREIRVGWPANSLWVNSYAGTKSLLFPKGRLRTVLSTAIGTGYTQAGVAWSISTDATTPPTLQPVVVSGGIDHWIVLTNGSADATRCTVTVTGDGTGATAVAYVGNWIAGALIFNKGAEFGFVHSYNNAQGPAVEVRNDDSGASPRFNADFIMGESSWGGVLIGDHTEYQIGRCDTHSNGAYSGPPALPSLMIASDRGGMISNWKERRDASPGNGALAGLIRGRGNRVAGRVQGNSGYTGDAVLVGGTGTSVDIMVQDISGFALSTDYDITCSDIRLTSNANGGVWKNYANASTISNIDSSISISAYGSVAVASAYTGLNNLSYGQWRDIRIIDKRSDSGAISYSSATLSATVDLTSTAEQVFTINHSIVRTPSANDIVLQVRPNSSATLTGVNYAYPSSITSTNVTIKLKLSAVGVGTGSLLVSIA